MENCLETFEGYVKTVGERLKIEGLDLDENHDCYLAFDSKYYVKCSVNPEKEQCQFFAYIGALPEDKAIYYQGILESCHFWSDTAGASISLDPDDGTLTLTQFCDMNMMDAELFYNTLEKFVNAMEHWSTKRLMEWMELTEEETGTGAAPVGAGGPAVPGMMMFGA
jgi:hypothetical protein